MDDFSVADLELNDARIEFIAEYTLVSFGSPICRIVYNNIYRAENLAPEAGLMDEVVWSGRKQDGND